MRRYFLGVVSVGIVSFFATLSTGLFAEENPYGHYTNQELEQLNLNLTNQQTQLRKELAEKVEREIDEEIEFGVPEAARMRHQATGEYGLTVLQKLEIVETALKFVATEREQRRLGGSSDSGNLNKAQSVKVPKEQERPSPPSQSRPDVGDGGLSVYPQGPKGVVGEGANAFSPSIDSLEKSTNRSEVGSPKEGGVFVVPVANETSVVSYPHEGISVSVPSGEPSRETFSPEILPNSITPNSENGIRMDIPPADEGDFNKLHGTQPKTPPTPNLFGKEARPSQGAKVEEAKREKIKQEIKSQPQQPSSVSSKPQQALPENVKRVGERPPAMQEPVRSPRNK